MPVTDCFLTVLSDTVLVHGECIIMEALELHEINFKRVLFELATDLKPYLDFANEHNCEYFTTSTWNRCLNKDFQNELDVVSVDDLRQRLSDSSSPMLRVSRAKKMPFDQCPASELSSCHHITDFLQFSHGNRLENLGVTTVCNELVDYIIQSQSVQERVAVQQNHVSHALGDKKSHEIEIMSSLCSQVSDLLSVSRVIDIGSGKGYLGCNIALQHGLNVLGIDACASNTHGAEIRTSKIEKIWPALVEKSSKNNFYRNL